MSVVKSGKFKFVSSLSFPIVSNPRAILRRLAGPLPFYTRPLRLNNPQTYQPLPHNITNSLKKDIQAQVSAMKQNGFIIEDWHKFCLEFVLMNWWTQNIQTIFLLKIHKNPHGIRPILSSCESITENLSSLVDHWLQPYVKELPSYIKDSTSFINLLEKLKLPNDCLLVSIDVSSLYANIPHKDGLESLLYYVSNEELKFKHPEQPEPEV